MVSGRSSSGSAATVPTSALKYNAMFSFGDSMAETGNICLASTNKTELEVLTCTHRPYGMTYFGRPACRWCNGRVVTDFIAHAIGLPLLPPSKAKGKDFPQGVNMAMTAGTALNFSFYKSLGVEDPMWNLGSLDTQIQWFVDLMPSICGTKESCKDFLGRSLFLFGGFGGNDYNAQIIELSFTPEQAMNHTPKIINAIADGVEKLIAVGAVHIVVPSIFPTGCLPIFLWFYGSSSSRSSFDQSGCLKDYNRLTEYHNSMLQKQVKMLQEKYRLARIMYADWSTPVYKMVQHPQKFGFSAPLETCCGAGGGKYNVDVTTRCGMPGATACRRPVGSRELGRHPPDGGGQQDDRRCVAQGPLLHSSNPRLNTPTG